MSFNLTSTKGEPFNINAWNWKTVTKLFYSADLISSETLEHLSYNGSGVVFSEEQALKMTSFLESYLKTLPSDTKRILFDLNPSNTIDNGILYRAEADIEKNYSVSVKILASLRDFLKASGGFEFS